MKNFVIFDIETDGLLADCTKVHCMSYATVGKWPSRQSMPRVYTYRTETGIRERIATFIKNGYIFVGHNIIQYDFPVLKKLYNIDPPPKNQIIDTLALSFYLYPYQKKHGLEYWGDKLKMPKVVIKDWTSLSKDEYTNRCIRDVKINVGIFFGNFLPYLNKLYSGNPEKIIRYLNFKMDCLRKQTEHPITLDLQKCVSLQMELEYKIATKLSALKKHMPTTYGIIIRKKPAKAYRKDGTITKSWETWQELLMKHNLPLTTEVVREDPNPSSNVQLKMWLDSLGWVPETFKVSKATGESVPQVSLPYGRGICPSVQKLYKANEGLKNLEELFMLKHRLGLCKSFTYNSTFLGYQIVAEAVGFTNTLRLKHKKPIVNLPGVGKPYGKEIRSLLKVPGTGERHLMCGSDVSALEDSTKQHYMTFFDPAYVKEMRVPGFCPHLDIASLADIMTKEEIDEYKALAKIEVKTSEDSKRYKLLSSKRSLAKMVNFSGVYGVGPTKLAETLEISLEEAKKLHSAYWKRNKAVKKVSASLITKEVNGQKWLYNPVSEFYLYLKAEKDRFSTLNQSTGVYVVDCWIKYVNDMLAPFDTQVSMQYHDEVLVIHLKEDKDIIKNVLESAIKKVNEMLNLNVPIGISVEFGTNYAECH